MTTSQAIGRFGFSLKPRALCGDKVIWMGFPGAAYVLEPEATKEYALNLPLTKQEIDRIERALD